MNWIIGIAILAAAALIGYLLDREIYFYEGARLGSRVQAWLYDRWSKKYDEGKRASQLRDDEMLAQPLLEALRDVPEPLVLDFATGTGRLSLALLKRAEFNGRIIALDLSQGMLEQAASKLHRASTAGQKSAAPPLTTPALAGGARVVPMLFGSAGVEFLRHLSLPLPFPDAAFDAVCALEVLELFPGMDKPLRELIRVLRPGGVLLTSRGTEESGRKAKVKSVKELTALLEMHGLELIQITRWWKLFDRVLALKQGKSAPSGMKSLSEVLTCSSCGHTRWAKASNVWECRDCGKHLPVTEQKIVLN